MAIASKWQGENFGHDLFDVEFGDADGDLSVCVRDRGTWREPQVTPDRGRGLPLDAVVERLADTAERALMTR